MADQANDLFASGGEADSAPDDGAITILSVEVENFQRLAMAKLDGLPSAGLVRVTGPNRAGKTSLLRAVAAALGGAGAIADESAALTDGSDRGRIAVRLSNGYRVERRLTAANPKGYLTITGPDGAKATAASTLAEWGIGERAFDPLAVLALPPRRLREVLLGLARTPGLAAELDAIAAQRAALEEERRVRLSVIQRAERTPPPPGERPTPVDSGDLLARVRRLREDQARRTRLLDAAEEARRRAASIRRQIEDLTRQLDEAESEAARAAHEAAQLNDPAPELERAEAELAAAAEAQKRLAPWIQWDALQEDVARAREEVDAIRRQLAALDARQVDLLRHAGIPVDGLTFGPEGEPLLTGRPLAVASGAERIRFAVQCAVAANPRLRVCLVDEANDLDLEALAALEEEARRRGFQIWVCRLGLEGPGDVTVEDGRAQMREE